MQVKNTAGNFEFPAIETAIKQSRLGRYMPVPGYDRETAIKFYIWNCQLSEAFQFPLHMAEVTCRNAIQKGLNTRFKNPWFDQPDLKRLLDRRQLDHLEAVIAEERHQHAAKMTGDHIVSSLSFGFWDHLTTKRFDRTLWLRGIQHNFPGAYSARMTLSDVNALIQKVRRWRNRIAHHRAIFDKDPARKYDETLRLIEWVCPKTARWVDDLSNVRAALALRPA